MPSLWLFHLVASLTSFEPGLPWQTSTLRRASGRRTSTSYPETRHRSATAENTSVALDSRDKSVTLEAFNGGIANFDTLFSICLIVFQSITLEGWVDVTYLITDAPSGFYKFPLLSGRGVHRSLPSHECNARCGLRGVRRIEGEAGDTGI